MNAETVAQGNGFAIGTIINVRPDIVSADPQSAFDRIFGQIAGREVTVVDLANPFPNYVTIAWRDEHGAEREMSVSSGVLRGLMG